MEETFSERVRRYIRTCEADDPAGIAEALVWEMKPSEIREAFLDILPTYITTQITRTRWTPVVEEDLEFDNGFSSPTPNPGRLATMLAQPSVVVDLLSKRLCGVDGWKRAADFTIADCEYAAEERRARARGMEKHAQQFDACIVAMKKANVDLLGAVDDSTIKEIFA
jgi:hypothetical protein